MENNPKKHNPLNPPFLRGNSLIFFIWMNMAYQDLSDFIKKLENSGQLRRIKTEVSAELEIAEITDRVSKVYGPALLFEKVKGYSMPVLINAFGSYERMAMALNVKHVDEIAREIESLVKPEMPSTFIDKIKFIQIKNIKLFIST